MDQIRTLLLEHDDPRHLERPADFDLDASRDCFARLARALTERFGHSCSTGLAQDASFYGVIHVPADATGLARPMSVAMSNFDRRFVTADMVADERLPNGEAGLTEEMVKALVAAGEVAEDDDDEEEMGKAYWRDRYFQYM
ncbi:hypothetical protein [Streptomyces sp. NPDC056463]|uniref:hypothetical protein n=1 Tax=Streptomyces sp. NPDC056463 TaxID=3345827 RepID=UPI0036CD5B09